MSLYSREVYRIFHGARWPKGLIIDIVEYQESVALRLYRDNFEDLSDTARQSVAEQMQAVIGKIRAVGCPCFLEVEANVPQ